jgi:hypothetical protein
MQPMLSTVLSLFLAHLLADFPFQPDWIAREKGKRLWPTLVHAGVHYVLASACLFGFTGISLWSLFHQCLLAAYVAAHILIDATRTRLITRTAIPDNWVSFLIDQLAHAATLVGVALALTGSGISTVIASVSFSPAARFQLLVVSTIYAASMFGGGYLIRYFTRQLSQGVVLESPNQLRNAGLYIGWIERFLVITAIAVHSPAMVGLILTGKSIARLQELKEVRFAEYFLIGTLLSISLALAGGLLLARILYGTVSLQ